MAEAMLESPAILRRQGARDIAQLILALSEHQDRDGDFQVFTYPIVREVGRLIEQLLHADQEGNAREVLRQARDTFRDGSWDCYRRSEVRQAVAALLLEQLADPERVPSAAVKLAFDRFLVLGLRPVARVSGLFDSLAQVNGADDGGEDDRGSP